MSKFLNYDNYDVYEDGRIYSYKSKKFLKHQTDKDGYQIVCLVNNEGKKKTYRLHRVVYESVTGETIPEGMQVNHINEIKTDNRFENLNLMTPKENINWGTGIKRSAKARINGKRSKSVGAFKNSELVFTFPSTMEACRQGFNQGHVYDCCNGNRKTHKGYEWGYL